MKIKQIENKTNVNIQFFCNEMDNDLFYDILYDMDKKINFENNEFGFVYNTVNYCCHMNYKKIDKLTDTKKLYIDLYNYFDKLNDCIQFEIKIQFIKYHI